jgi:hypothetical protein
MVVCHCKQRLGWDLIVFRSESMRLAPLHGLIISTTSRTLTTWDYGMHAVVGLLSHCSITIPQSRTALDWWSILCHRRRISCCRAPMIIVNMDRYLFQPRPNGSNQLQTIFKSCLQVVKPPSTFGVIVIASVLTLEVLNFRGRVVCMSPQCI